MISCLIRSASTCGGSIGVTAGTDIAVLGLWLQPALPLLSLYTILPLTIWYGVWHAIGGSRGVRILRKS